MIKDTVTIDDTINLLNELLKIDHECIYNLVNARVGCNNLVEDHPTVQVTSFGSNVPVVGIIGILNGLFGVNDKGFGPISFEMANDKILEFKKLN